MICPPAIHNAALLAIGAAYTGASPLSMVGSIQRNAAKNDSEINTEEHVMNLQRLFQREWLAAARSCLEKEKGIHAPARRAKCGAAKAAHGANR